MKNKHILSRSRGFTLVELLTVIAIIGILAAIVIPTVGKVQETAKKSAASSNGRQIGLAYVTFANTGGRSRNITNGTDPSQLEANSPALFAQVLAERAGLNDASMWYITSDPALAAKINSIPKTVIATSSSDGSTANNMTGVTPASWGVITNLATNAPTSTTPVVFTRGITPTGSTWDTDSPWEGDGGHIVFLDGHVGWYEDLTLDNLVSYDGSNDGEATNIQNAVNTAAQGTIYQDSSGE